MSFPFDWSTKKLDESDISLFSLEFSEIVNLFLPSRNVHFVGAHSAGELSSAWKAGVEMVRNAQKPVVDSGEEEHLYLPLWDGDALFCVAILDNSPGTYQDSSSSMLLEKSRLISTEMARVKQYALDPVTGLPGGRMLQSRLQALLDKKRAHEKGMSFSLLLLEIYPRTRYAEQALAQIAGTSSFLDALIGHLFTPCHLGNGIFGLLWEGVDEPQTMKTADLLLRWLKREGFARSSIGIRTCMRDSVAATADVFLEQAWEALRVAGRRGPFALCSHHVLKNRNEHPLCPPSAKIFAALRKLWQNCDSFTLLLLHADDMQNKSSFVWPDMAGAPLVPLNSHEAYVYLENADRHTAEAWINHLRAKTAGHSVNFSIGGALYPDHGFKKPEIAGNCRKALLHTRFYGPGTTTFFDGVSLNISGDIYYNEGDLTRAAAEYRLGLQLDPTNVNLLNSMAVTFAQMNLYRKAIPLFHEVLALQPVNFMALYNLGFAYLATGEEENALEKFEKALLYAEDDNFDLLLQLGKLYCNVGRFTDAVSVLRRGEQIGPGGVRDVSHGAVHRFLGEAYKGLGENSKAISCLQKAARHNPRDAAVLSMLGELFFLEKQGNEIALTLCRQAVELDDDWRYWARLALVLTAQREYDEALRALRKALALDSRNVELMLQLGTLYELRGKISPAAKIYNKILRLDPHCGEAEKRLALLMRKEC